MRDRRDRQIIQQFLWEGVEHNGVEPLKVEVLKDTLPNRLLALARSPHSITIDHYPRPTGAVITNKGNVTLTRYSNEISVEQTGNVGVGEKVIVYIKGTSGGGQQT